MTPTQEQIAEVKRMIKVQQDWCDGKTVQCCCREDGYKWLDCEDGIAPIWNWDTYDYRTKPEPRRFWMHKARVGIMDPEPYIRYEKPSDPHLWIETIEVLP